MTEQEEILWEKEVLSSCSAPLLQILTKTVFLRMLSVVFVDVTNTVNLWVSSLFSTPTIRENSFSSWEDKAKPTREDYDRCSRAMRTSNIAIRQEKLSYQ